jgi:hypothetical protein
MSIYKVTVARVEHTVFVFNVDAISEDIAEELAIELWENGDYEGDGETVHGETFVNAIELVKG